METQLNNLNLPIAPTHGVPMSVALFDCLLAAARKGGWPAIFTTYAEGETVNETMSNGNLIARPARRRTLEQFLNKRPDLKLLLDSACQERRDLLISKCADEVEKIALGEGDKTTDYNAAGAVIRTRIDRRNKLYAALKLLASHDPDTYAERRKLAVDGTIQHQHQLNAPANTYSINAEEIGQLSPEDQNQLFMLMEKVEAIRHQRLDNKQYEQPIKLIDVQQIERTDRVPTDESEVRTPNA